MKNPPKTIILAGGLDTRPSEETVLRLKPMVETSGQPILWHSMNIYAHHGFRKFIVALGYKRNQVKDYYLAIPLQKGQLSCRELFPGETLVRPIKALESLTIDHLDNPYSRVSELRNSILAHEL